MAHCIETLFSYRTVPWHGLGRIIDTPEPPTSRDAIIYAGLDWAVEKRQALVMANNGSILEVPDRFITVRQKDDAIFGVVGSDYQIVQNQEAFDFADALLGEGLRYETAGALHGGSKIWLLGKMPSVDILGDVIEPYIVLTNSHDGRGAIKVAITPVRVVCQNTLNMALSGATRTWATRHVGNMQAKLEAARTTLSLTALYMQNLKKQAEIMVAKPVNVQEVHQIANILFMPTDATERQTNTANKRIAEFEYRYFNAPDLEDFRGTAWGVMGALSDMITHAEPIRRTQNYQERLMEGAIEGYDLLNEAQTLLMAA